MNVALFVCEPIRELFQAPFRATTVGVSSSRNSAIRPRVKAAHRHAQPELREDPEELIQSDSDVSNVNEWGDMEQWARQRLSTVAVQPKIALTI